MLAPGDAAGFVAGFFLGGSLIVAIGAQNAFVLRQGLVGRHVLAVCLICAVADAALITLGVAGLGTAVAGSPALVAAATLGGAAFLLFYAGLSFRRALRPGALLAAGGAATTLRGAVAACLAFTVLNPHVYLDTVLLLGSVSAGYGGTARAAFGAGAVAASFAWFFALGYGARLLQPVFARPAAWRVLDVAIGLVMGAIAVGLLGRLHAA
ncbi:LysE family transporter [Aquibium sp. A9E412]|uniref:LysE/ArgO family amino acid transporter n=1 Tax=Aquibium sp. A9E412 TaxID=2976767 RepID=UPI0025B22B5F|nr:LysE family transporter [Aquibium sp. A9E412]MDN2567167.1 LysE family transporter [Aquibium sp. A9E412]